MAVAPESSAERRASSCPGAGLDAVVLQPPGPAGHHQPPFHGSHDSAARCGTEIGDGGQAGAVVGRPAGDGCTAARAAAAIACGDRMLGGCLDRAGQPQDFRLAERREGHRGIDGKLPAGDRAGLVQQDGVHGAGVLEDLRAPDEDAQLGAAPGSGQEPHGSGQAERARARNHQHRHRGRERSAQLGSGDVRAGGKQPGGERQDGDRQDDRDEYGTDPVSEPGDRRLSGLRLGNEPAHLGQRCFRADPGGADQQPAGRC